MFGKATGSGGRGRRAFLAGAAVLLAGGAAASVSAIRRRVRNRLSRLTLRADFSATPDLLPHDPAKERRTIYVSRGLGPAANVDAVLRSLGGMASVVGKDDVVIVKVSAQWWNQGMTNVAAVRRVIEQILEVPGFTGEVVVFENTHFLKDGSSLTRAFTRPSERNVDVPGWQSMNGLVSAFAGKRVGFVGLVDAAKSSLAGDGWHDPAHEHGIYGGDGRGPIAAGKIRDGYRWDFTNAFRVRRSLVDDAQTPLTWPVFISPVSGLVIDLKDGVLRRDGERLVTANRKLTWINMPTCNEHMSTGLTCCCKSAMGVVDMSAGYPGVDPSTRDWQSVHYFGNPNASWRMAGPLAHFAKHVRAPDLHIATAEWVAAAPPLPAAWDPDDNDLRLAAASAHHVGAIIAGTDPIAIDSWCARNLLVPILGQHRALYDLDNPDSLLSRFLREYRRVYGMGTLDPALITVA